MYKENSIENGSFQQKVEYTRCATDRDNMDRCIYYSPDQEGSKLCKYNYIYNCDTICKYNDYINSFSKDKKILLVMIGYMQSGKDTFASFLPKYYTRFAFADRIKEIAKDCFGWDGEKDDAGRKLLQQLGTEVGREYDSDIWVKTILDKLFTYYFEEDKQYAIITDCRFHNEQTLLTEFCNDNNIIIKFIKIIRTFDENLNKMNYDHVSESFVDLLQYNYICQNNGTLDDLENQVQKILFDIELNIERNENNKKIKGIVNSVVENINTKEVDNLEANNDSYLQSLKNICIKIKENGENVKKAFIYLYEKNGSRLLLHTNENQKIEVVLYYPHYSYIEFKYFDKSFQIPLLYNKDMTDEETAKIILKTIKYFR